MSARASNPAPIYSDYERPRGAALQNGRADPIAQSPHEMEQDNRLTRIEHELKLIADFLQGMAK